MGGKGCWWKFPIRMQDKSQEIYSVYLYEQEKRCVFHFVLFQCFYMYKIYLKYFMLKLANALLLKNTIICECTHASDEAFWPTASWLKCLWCNTLHQIKHVREEFPFLDIHLLIQLQVGDTASHSISHGNWFIGTSPVTVWNPVSKPAFKFNKQHYSWCPNCFTIFSLSFFSSSMWAFRHSRMCWDLSSSSSMYLAAIDPTEVVGRGH